MSTLMYVSHPLRPELPKMLMLYSGISYPLISREISEMVTFSRPDAVAQWRGYGTMWQFRQ